MLNKEIEWYSFDTDTENAYKRQAIVWVCVPFDKFSLSLMLFQDESFDIRFEWWDSSDLLFSENQAIASSHESISIGKSFNTAQDALSELFAVQYRTRAKYN